MKILVCVDGEPHSNDAIQRAIYLGLTQSACVTALHVIDPWLKKFYNELYSQGRREYLEYVDECLASEAGQLQDRFVRMCQAAGLDAGFKTRHGDPASEILEEIGLSAPDLLITGYKQLTAWGRFRSRNLPLQLSERISQRIPVMSV